MDEAVISSINCLFTSAPSLVVNHTSSPRVWNNPLTDIDFKPKRRLVPLLGDVENVLYIKIYHHWSHPACRRLWHNINSLQDVQQLEDEQDEDK